MPAVNLETYERVCQHVRQGSLLASIEALLGWDERCMLPAAAGGYRAEQITLMAGLVHDRQTDPRLGDWLEELAATPLAADPTSDSGATIRQLKRQFDRRVKLPKSLVEELAKATVLGQQVWVEARAKKSFPLFLPSLEQILRLKREQADALGFTESPYDPLVDEYEQDATAADLTKVLSALRDELVPLVAAVKASGRSPDTSVLARRYPIETQQAFGSEVATKIGFSFERGRLDVTTHPFCTTLGPHDCRITTRYQEDYFNSGFFGILHEAGHGIYEQGLVPGQYGLPLGEATSLGAHESQSRLWENFVGRSLPFWQHFFPQAQRAFPQALGDVKLETFYHAVNDVRPSLIRVEADEATYNLHILIRFELEQELLADELDPEDLPTAWNAKYKAALGVEPADDAEGCLQDIHWSAGLIGYFPTYSLGNLYAAQLYDKADAELGGLAAQFAKGEFAPLKGWLVDNIHHQGQRYPAADLIARVTGQPLSHAPLIRHLRSRLAPIYGL